MTPPYSAMSLDGALLSEADLAPTRTEANLTAERLHNAVRVVAASSHSAEDCRELLAMLGLDREVVADARRQLNRKPVRKRRDDAA